MTSPSSAPPDLERLEKAKEALERLGMVLGIAPDLIACETRDRLACQISLAGERLAGVPAIASALANFGSALRVEVRAAELCILIISATTSAADVSKAQQDLDGQVALLDFVLDKREWLLDLGLIHPQAEVALFMSAAALLRELGEPLSELENRVFQWAADTHKLIVVVAGSSIRLSGEHLAIVGSKAAEGWASIVPPQEPSDARILAMRKQAFQSLSGPASVNWLGFEIRKLTPVHLALDLATLYTTLAPNDESIRRALLRVEGLLSIIYTATQVTAPEVPKGDWMAVYAAEGKIARVSWRGDGAVSESSSGNSLEEGCTLGELALWAYSSQPPSTDRLTVLRDVIVRSLMGNDPWKNYRLLVGQAVAFRDRAFSSWNTFIDGKLDRYFGHVRELEQVVDASVKAASEQVDGLTKSLIESALAAVGVIVASFLAAVFKDTFDPLVYRVGVSVYAIYLIIFPGAIGLLASWQRFAALDKGFEERKQNFSYRLSEDEVKRTVGTGFTSAKQRYLSWLTVAALIYLVLVGLLVWSLGGVPRLLAAGRGKPAAVEGAPGAVQGPTFSISPVSS